MYRVGTPANAVGFTFAMLFTMSSRSRGFGISEIGLCPMKQIDCTAHAPYEWKSGSGIMYTLFHGTMDSPSQAWSWSPLITSA